MLYIPSNITAPAAIQVTLQSPVFGPDLTTVTGVSFGVVRRDGTTTTWAASIVSATSSQLVARYTFTGIGEITSTGVYILAPQLTLPGGRVPAESVTVFVATPSAVQPQTETTAWVLASSNLAPSSTHFDWAAPATGSGALSAFYPYVPLDLRGGSLAFTLWAGTGGDPITLADLYATATTYTLAPTGGQAIYSAGSSHTGAVSFTGLTRLKYSSGLNAWVGF